MPGSQLVRRQLGIRLVAERRRAKFTINHVVTAGVFSESKMIKIENGKQAVKPGDVWTLCDFYQSSPEVMKALTAMAPLTSSDAVWEDNPDVVPEWFGMYLGLESSCSELRYWHPELVPGVFQQPDYARAVINTDGTIDEEVIQHRLNLRHERQTAMLNRTDRRVQVVLGTGATALEIGSVEAMADQRQFLCKLNSLTDIDIRILPRRTGAHPGLSTRFSLLDFEDDLDPSVVYLESITGARYLESRRDVETYRQAFSTLYELSIPIEEFS